MSNPAELYDVELGTIDKANNIKDTRPFSYCSSYYKINDTYNKWSVVFIVFILFIYIT